MATNPNMKRQHVVEWWVWRRTEIMPGVWIRDLIDPFDTADEAEAYVDQQLLQLEQNYDWEIERVPL